MLLERDYNRDEDDTNVGKPTISETPMPEHVAHLIARYRAELADREKSANRLAFAKYLVDRGLISEGVEE